MDDFKKVTEVNGLMSGCGFSWCIAGGWAIDMFLGRQSRTHNDIEIAIFRDDQLRVRQSIQKGEFKYINPAEPGILHNWIQNEALRLPIHEIHVIAKGVQFEVLLNEKDGEKNGNNWIYRRDASIKRDISKFKIDEPSAIYPGLKAIPYLSPEIALLYKSKNNKAKDDYDFKNAVEIMDAESKDWLKSALQSASPGHPWVKLL